MRPVYPLASAEQILFKSVPVNFSFMPVSLAQCIRAEVGYE